MFVSYLPESGYLIQLPPIYQPPSPSGHDIATS